eukprot:gnl/Spiro4/8125_TR4285_c0_g1_i1.p1 gnl/Spiro4/8125_TR4285_c0_g1~~gnl/Spiro4/8125_TR4285_c0_g1_i1.p1  ORF type:complete len:357 (+),score=69.20 gnl/Spiro4/8125_TR4285_c0_g1_i1:52-1122(+)
MVLFSTVSNVLRPFIVAQVPTIVRVQRFFGLSETSKNPIVHAFFEFCTALGDETVYIVLLPMLHWAVPELVIPRLILLWAIVYWLGQGLKNALHLPRPGVVAPTHVIQAESKYSLEFGFPSTHAIGAATVPLYLLLFVERHYCVSSPWLWGLFVFWASCICLSRLYLGAHFPLDIVGGLAISVIVTLGYVQVDEWICEFCFSGDASVPLVAFVTSAALLAVYPYTVPWSTSFNDIATVIGVAHGCVVTNHFVPQRRLAATFFSCSRSFTSLDTSFLPVVAVGMAMVLTTRTVVKSLLTPLFRQFATFCFPDGSSEPSRSRRRYLEEIPCKFLTYSSVGGCACVLPGLWAAAFGWSL